MSTDFTPIFLFLLVAIGIAPSMLVASALFGPNKRTAVKQMPYESGMNPFGDARQRFDVRYYLIAIVFLLFDVELLFLYPWAVAQWSGAAPEAAPPTRRHGRWRGHTRRVPQPGVLGHPDLHRDPGGGVRLRLEEGGLRMAMTSSPSEFGLPRPRRPCIKLRSQPAGAPQLPENTFVTKTDAVVTGAASTASGRCRSPPPAAGSS